MVCSVVCIPCYLVLFLALQFFQSSEVLDTASSDISGSKVISTEPSGFAFTLPPASRYSLNGSIDHDSIRASYCAS